MGYGSDMASEELMDTEMTNASTKPMKGRGAQSTDNKTLIEGEYETIEGDQAEGEAVKSIEGWIVFLTGVHEEAEENELLDRLCEFGTISNFQLQLDRRTGFVKGYALAEFEKKEEAEAALEGLDGSEFMEQTLHASWAFVSRPKRT